MARTLTETEERRRTDLIGLKELYSLTNKEISNKLPPGTASKRTVDNWVSGSRAVPVMAMEILFHQLEGKTIPKKEDL